MTKYESEIKHLSYPQQMVYERLSDLRNFEAVRERLKDPAVQAKLAEQVPADKLEQARAQFENVEFEQDCVRIQSPMGKVALRIIEREEPKLLKFEGEGVPMPLNLWVQLLPEGEYGTKLKVTVGAEVNFFMKGMVAKPLQQAADGIANMLAMMG